MPNSLLKGESLLIIAISLLGWASFAFGDASVKYLAQSYHPSYLVILCATINTLILTGFIAYKKGLKGFVAKKKKLMMVRGALTGGISYFIVSALHYIPIADVYGVTFSVPFIAVILSFLFLKEEVGRHRWTAIIVGFMGVLIVVGPNFDVGGVGFYYAISAMALMGASVITMRMIGTSEYMPLVFLYNFIGMLIINLIIGWDIISELPVPDLNHVWLIIVNALLTLGGIGATTYALAHAKSTASITPFLYSQALWGVILGYFVFNDIPTLPTIIGLSIVIGAGLYMIYRERQLNKVRSGA